MTVRRSTLSMLGLTVCLSSAPSGVFAHEHAAHERPAYEHEDGGRPDRPSSSVFVLGNDTEVNSVLAYALRGQELHYTGTFATAGKGGAAGNQGGLALVAERNMLLAVNAGSDSLTAFDIKRDYLSLRDVTSAHGSGPVSLASCTADGSGETLVYALNAASRSIAGFTLGADGELAFIDGSVQGLSESTSGPAQILFDNTCSMLIVVERNPDSFMLYHVGDEGAVSAGINVASLSAGQLGSAITKDNQLLVSETGTSAASSFALDTMTPDIQPISQTVANGQAGSCWAAATMRSFRCADNARDCSIGYIMNAGSDNITSYTIAPDGVLDLREVVAAETFGGAFDGALAGGDRFLVVQSRPDMSSRALNLFTVEHDGELIRQQTIEGLPANANSVAATN